MNDDKGTTRRLSNDDLADKIGAAGVRATAVRLMIYRFMTEVNNPVSSLDIESSLETVDKSTISRTLSSFLDHDLIHSIDDGSGLLKYEVCRGDNRHSMNDMHVHFRCTCCGKTTCLHSTAIPEVTLPEGYVAESANYVISGLCSKCSDQ